jgi:hypothetical protein
MAANSKRRAQPQTLALEALEDRVLLSLAAGKSILPRVDVFNQAAVVSAAIPQSTVIHIDQQYGATASPFTDLRSADRWIDRADSGRLDKRDGATDELREHLVNESARLVRTEGETVRILTEQPIVAAHESFNQVQARNEPENSHQFNGFNGPAQIAADVPALPLRSASSLNPPLGAAISPLAALPYEEGTPKDDVSDVEMLDPPPPLIIAAANNVSGPAAIMPLLEGLQFSMPDARRAVDEFLARLTELGVAPSSSWSSLSFSVWLAVVAGAAVETARRMATTKGQRLSLLMANGRTLAGSPAEEP